MARPRLLRSAAFVLFQTLVVLLLLEVAVRIVRPYHDGLRLLLYLPEIATDFDAIDSLEELMKKSVIGYYPYRPAYGFVANSHGFRTPEVQVPKPDELYRVVLLGDSFTFACGGIPYSLGWPALLERQLRDSPAGSRNLEVVNLGVPAIGPLFERRLWQLEGLRLDPDLVVLAFFVGNDFSDEREVTVDRPWRSTLVRWSLVLRLVRNLRRVSKAQVEAPPEARDGASQLEAGRPEEPGELAGGYEIEAYRDQFAQRPPKVSRQALMEIEAPRTLVCDLSRSEELEPLFASKLEILRHLVSEIRDAQSDVAVVVIPDRFQVNLDEQETVLGLLGRDASGFDWTLPQVRLTGALEQQGVAVLDLLPPFLEHAREQALYNEGDTHWSVAGNQLAAEEIAAWLETTRLLPAARALP